MEQKDRLRRIFENLEIGIGEVSNSLGVSQRQLRYWEQKGYIKPIDDKSGVRRYSLATVFLIGFIKDQLDEGYTLSAAVQHSKDIRVKSKIARKFLRSTFEKIEITDFEKGYGTIKLGQVDTQDKKIDIEGVIDDKGSHFELKEK